MGTPTGLRPARLGIGIISAGRVGTALGVALERAEHVVVACSAIPTPDVPVSTIGDESSPHSSITERQVISP